MSKNKIFFQFLAEPNDVNFGGKVHGGIVMKWIDQTAFACASHWSSSYCVTIYVGGIRFLKPIQIGDLVHVDAKIIYTGRTSMHIAVDVTSRKITSKNFVKTTHCIIVFVAVDSDGHPMEIPKWIPQTNEEKSLETYAIKLTELRKQIENEMSPFTQGE